MSTNLCMRDRSSHHSGILLSLRIVDCRLTSFYLNPQHAAAARIVISMRLNWQQTGEVTFRRMSVDKGGW